MQQAAREKKFSRLIGQIDIEINKSASSGDKAQLYCNRGLCHQRLNLNRKALKVSAACSSSTKAGMPTVQAKMTGQRAGL